MTGGSLSANPYSCAGPVRDARGFFGREEQLRATFEAIQKMESVSLVGPRRSGKTSLLYFLLTDAARQAYSFDHQHYLFVYLDPQLGIRDPREFYYELKSALAREVPSLKDDAGANVTRRDIRRLVQDLAPRRLVLLVDEFERLIGQESFPIDFFSFLRGLAQNHGVCFIAATMDRLCDCCWGEWVGSPLYNIFRPPLYLGSWSESEFDHFLDETSKRSGAPIVAHKSAIFELAGRFPAYVQMACSFYFDVWRQGEITAQDRAQVQHRFAREAGPDFERMWKKHLTAPERAVLAELACGRDPEDVSMLTNLTQRGLVVDGRVFSSQLAHYVLEQQAGAMPLPPSLAAPQVPADGGVWVDQKAGEVWIDGEKLVPPLTNLEYKLLLCLYANADCICGKYEIVEAVWSGSYIDHVDDSRIAKLVSRLRERVEPDPKHPRYILTVHGRGYRLAAEPVQADA